MKRIISLCALLFTLVLSSFAQSSQVPVTMVSYEQRWLDREGTIALKNNTSEQVTRVCFQITYMDMKDNPLDYEVYTKRVSIAPGMVKKVDIPAYEHDRQYHYYKTPRGMGMPTFKIAYKFKSYNGKRQITPKASPQEPAVASKPAVTPKPRIKKSAPASHTPIAPTEEISDKERKNSTEEIGEEYAKEEQTYDDETDIYDLIYLWLIFSIAVALYIIVALMALHRNRSAVAWVLLSIVITPLVSIFLLFIMGTRKEILFSYEND